MAEYSLGCVDINGQALGPTYAMGERKNRIFDPSGNPKYAGLYGAPVEVLVYDKIDELTYLRFGSQHCLTDDERKAVKKLAKKGGHKLKDAERYGINYDTIVVQVAARTRQGDAIAARYFGENSQFNRTGMPHLNDSPDKAICASVDIGCQAIQAIVRHKKHIGRVIFMTSSQGVIDIATKIWDWHQGGFPTLVNSTPEDAYILHHNLKNLEAMNDGIQAMFWKVDQQYLSGAVFDVNCRFDDLHHVPNTHRWDPVNNVAVLRDCCLCGNCVFRTQILELQYAATGRTCCDCQGSRRLLTKYGQLKAGDQFPLTNNADMDVKLTMKVDAKRVAV